MGLLGDAVEAVKQLTSTAGAAAANTGSAVANAAAVQTAQTTSFEQNASVFDIKTNDVNENYDNKSSTTVILSQDYNSQKRTNYYNKDTKEVVLSYVKGEDGATSMDDIVKHAYGSSQTLTQSELNSAASAIIDNNRWMIDNINETYLTAQVVNELYPDGLPEGVSNDDIEKAISDHMSSEDFDINNYHQFDSSVRADQIPPEIIANTDFSEPANPEVSAKKVYVPDLQTLQQKGDTVDEQLSAKATFDSSEKKLEITAADLEGMSQAEAKQYIQDQIAKNYNLQDTNEDGSVDLLGSYAGANILTAISKEEGNNGLFAQTKDDPDTYIDKMYAQAMSGDGLTLYCPDTEMNILADGASNLSQEEVRDFLTQENGSTKITYVRALSDSVTSTTTFDVETKQDVEVLGMHDVLEAYEFNGQTLDDLAVSENASERELALSAIEQIVSNNPGMAQEAYDQYVKNLPEGTEVKSLESLTSEEKLNMYMAANYAEYANEKNNGEIVLENIQYIVGNETKAPTPKTVADTPDAQTTTPIETTPSETTPIETTPSETTPIETTPSETTPIETTPSETTPIETTPSETTPIETTPSETTPIETTPSETTPIETTPSETTPVETTECPDLPSVEPSDTEIEVTTPNKPIEEVTTPSETPTETEIEETTTCPSEDIQGDTSQTPGDTEDDKTDFDTPTQPEEVVTQPQETTPEATQPQETTTEAPYCPKEEEQGQTKGTDNKGADTEAEFESEAPATEAKAEAPATEAKAEAPAAEAPKAEAPQTEAPKVEAPKTEAPQAATVEAVAQKVEQSAPVEITHSEAVEIAEEILEE